MRGASLRSHYHLESPGWRTELGQLHSARLPSLGHQHSKHPATRAGEPGGIQLPPSFKETFNQIYQKNSTKLVKISTAHIYNSNAFLISVGTPLFVFLSAARLGPAWPGAEVQTHSNGAPGQQRQASRRQSSASHRAKRGRQGIPERDPPF